MVHGIRGDLLIYLTSDNCLSDDLHFKSYTKNYKNPATNVYNYTGLTAVTPSGFSLIIAYSSWTSGKPTGLYVSTSITPNTGIITRVEQNANYTLSYLTAMCIVTYSQQLYIFDRRESMSSSENLICLFIYPLKLYV